MTARDTATLSEKFQISIPKAVREGLGWRAGQVFAFVPRGGAVILVPVPRLGELAGVARGADTGAHRDRSERV